MASIHTEIQQAQDRFKNRRAKLAEYGLYFEWGGQSGGACMIKSTEHSGARTFSSAAEAFLVTFRELGIPDPGADRGAPKKPEGAMPAVSIRMSEAEEKTVRLVLDHLRGLARYDLAPFVPRSRR